MIEVKKNTTALEGNPEELMAELTYAIYHVTTAINKRTGMPIHEIDDELDKAVKIIRLAEAGMPIEEAHKVIIGEEKLGEENE